MTVRVCTPLSVQKRRGGAHESPVHAQDPRLDEGNRRGGGRVDDRANYFLPPPAMSSKFLRGSSMFSSDVSSRPETKLVTQPEKIRTLRV